MTFCSGFILALQNLDEFFDDIEFDVGFDDVSTGTGTGSRLASFKSIPRDLDLGFDLHSGTLKKRVGAFFQETA